MKHWTARIALIAVTALACGEPPSRARASGVHEGVPQATTSAPAPVDQLAELRAAAERVLAALRTRDTRALLAMVDERGITLGTDFPTISASTFRRDVQRKRGSYCDLFGCGASESGVRGMVAGRVLVLRPTLSRDFPGTGDVAVYTTVSATGTVSTDGFPTVSLGFVRRNGAWRLHTVEYI